MPLTSDTLVNLISGLGTVRDKSTGNAFALTVLDKSALDAAYRGDWIARKIVDVPAFDETREWRDWQADKPQIELLEQEEARHGVQRKVAQARKQARLYGGSAIFIGDGSADPMTPLVPERIGKGGLKYLNVFSRHEMVAGELDQDPLSPFYGEPIKYSLAGRTALVDIHPSRVVRFIGAEIPDRVLAFDGWGDSVLQAVNDAVLHASSASATIAALLQEAKVDIVKVPGFMESLATEEYRSRILQRYSLANTGKSITNTLMLDGDEEWNSKQISFAQLPEILNTYLQIASGAADIPATRLLGQTPGGLQSTGQSDIRNYYDRISAGQNLDLRPALSRLDEVLIRSAIGSRPDDVHYTWAPLWQMTEVEKADVFSKKTKGVKDLHDTGLVPDQALARGVQNMLVEDGTFPGLDTALDEFGDEPEDKEAEAEAQRRQAEQQGGTQTGGAPFVGDAYDPNQPRGPDGRWIDAGTRIMNVAALAGQNVAAHAVFAPVKAPAALSKLIGQDVRGFRHAISNQAIAHMKTRHPDLTAADFKRLPQIVRGQRTLSQDRGVNGVPRVLYRTSIEGVRYGLVVEVRRRAKRLDAITFYRI